MAKPMAFILNGLFGLAAWAKPQIIDSMYVNSFGDPQKPAVVFVHGGPGYNSHDFEISTADALAQLGYFVVLYDQRGQGRSQEERSLRKFNYRHYARDLKKIIDTFRLKQPVLVGHSHGGPIVLKFDQIYPQVAKALVLVAAPVNFPGAIKSIFENCARRYEDKGQSQNLDNLALVAYQLGRDEKLSFSDRTKFTAMAFAHGGQCGLYQSSNPSPPAAKIRQILKENPLPAKLSGLTTAMPGFFRNENYTHLDHLKHVIQERNRIYGIYGSDDGLFTPLEVAILRNALPANHFHMINGASHAVYVDQHDAFLKVLSELLR